MKESILIKLDESFARSIGFTSDLFTGYFTRIGKVIWISFIHSKEPHQGHFRNIIEKILSLKLVVRVPSPLPGMRKICIKNGYVQKKCYDKLSKEYVEYWEMRP